MGLENSYDGRALEKVHRHMELEGGEWGVMAPPQANVRKQAGGGHLPLVMPIFVSWDMMNLSYLGLGHVASSLSFAAITCISLAS